MNASTSGQSDKPYSPPLDKLLRYGDPGHLEDKPNYLAGGIGPEQIPELIRMAMDEALNNGDADSAEVWAPLHAWRALGQLRAEAAVEPLLTLFKRIDENDDDWVQSDLPPALGGIGPAALPALSAYMANPSHRLWARVAAAESIKEVAQQHPQRRAECVALLSQQMGHYAENGVTFNGSLVGFLLDLHAVEAVPVLEQAFAAEQVDESIAGDWEDVQVELGLKEQRETPARYTALPGFKKMLELGRQRAALQSHPLPDLKAINKAQKKARSEAKKAKWKRMLQRQTRR